MDKMGASKKWQSFVSGGLENRVSLNKILHPGYLLHSTKPTQLVQLGESVITSCSSLPSRRTIEHIFSYFTKSLRKRLYCLQAIVDIICSRMNYGKHLYPVKKTIIFVRAREMLTSAVKDNLLGPASNSTRLNVGL